LLEQVQQKFWLHMRRGLRREERCGCGFHLFSILITG
jgi:hypothetical protein